jgi:hypothetical protein
MIRRREFITLVGGVAAWPLAARGQPAGKVFRIGFVGLPTADSLPKRAEAFRAYPAFAVRPRYARSTRCRFV